TGGGYLELNGNVSLDYDGVDNQPGSFTVDGTNTNISVRIVNSLTIDTEQGNTDHAGAVSLGTGTISATGTGRTLTINTATSGLNLNGGQVSFGPVGNTGGGSYLTSLQVDSRATNGGTSGRINVDNNIQVDGGLVSLA